VHRSPNLGVGLSHGGGGQAQLGWGQLERPPTFAASGAGRGRSGGGALGDELAFELGQRGEDPEHELACGGGGVDRRALPGQHRQPDTASGQVVDGVDQVVQVAIAQRLRVRLRDSEAACLPDHRGRHITRLAFYVMRRVRDPGCVTGAKVGAADYDSVN
jgi:hypothetical protein